MGTFRRGKLGQSDPYFKRLASKRGTADALQSEEAKRQKLLVGGPVASHFWTALPLSTKDCTAF